MPTSRNLPFAERFKLVNNLMPILPPESDIAVPERAAVAAPVLTLLGDQHDLGRAHAALLHARRWGDTTGPRRLLRALQVLGALSYLNILLGPAIGAPAWCWLAPFLLVLFFKRMLFSGHLAVAMPGAGNRAAFWLLQIPADLAYAAGLLRQAVSPPHAR